MKIILHFGVLVCILCISLYSCENNIENENHESSKVINFKVKKELDSILSTLNAKYPHIIEKEFFCFNFIGQGNIYYLQNATKKSVFADSSLAFNERVEIEQYKFIDSISAISNRKIGYFFSLLNDDTVGRTDKFLHTAKFKNALILNNSDQLYSSLCALKKQTAGNILPAVFIIDKNGNLVYFTNAGIGNKILFLSLSNFVKSHQN